MSDQDIAVEHPERLETDYLIVGAGAMGMAFADVIFTQTPSARITMVDRRARPGGHWNDAYPFVALHQPAAFYGLNSAKLGTGGSDLASGPEIVAYYHRAMQRWQASGRLQFFSQSEYYETAEGEGQIVSILDESRVTQVTVKQRLVDAAYMHVEIPATHGPRYAVADGVELIPLNALARVDRAWKRYVIIGAGKTGMDAILFLLDRGVDPDRIRWIVSNDAWLWDRPSVQPGMATTMFLDQIEAIIEHRDVDRIFPALEAQGSMHRIDRTVTPTKWRCATVDPAEVESLRRVNDVVRMGRVQAVSANEIRLDRGSLPTDGARLHVDCTADGLAKRPPRPLFESGRITLQSIFMCQQVFAAAIIARMALLDMHDEQRNSLCRVVPHPEYKEDMPGCMVSSVENLLTLNKHMPLWLRRCRLNLMHHDSLWKYVAGAVHARRLLPQALAVVEHSSHAGAV